MIEEEVILHPNPSQFIVSTVIEKIERLQQTNQHSISATTKDPQDDD
tara:strand:- start:718 stop:858 length:141 start_codon:yes stop_codon:yes gene_type:complete